MLVLLLFFCSGATALVYEVLWSRYLTFMLGSTVQAQTVVLAVFMGGLAIGNRVFGKRSKDVAEPLRTYAILELIIGTYAFFFPKIYRVADFLFVQVGSAVVDLPVLPLTVKLLVSVILLLPPTILMGGTLPLLAMWIQGKTGWDAGARVGIFYAVNSLGAVLGAGLAGFFLVQNFGLISALELTALLNLLVGFFAVILSKREASELSKPAVSTETATAAATDPTAATGAWFGMLVAVTGGVSMGLEVASSRALALIAGGSVQSFALVLMGFILGIGLGSVVISSSRIAKKFGSEALYVLLIAASCLVILHVLMIEKWALIYTNARYGLAQNQIGYIWHQIAVGLLAFIILGLPAALLGAVVPLAIRVANIPGAALGDRVGRLLTWNTVGAVAGVLITGFLLMPLAGLRTALTVLGLVPLIAAGIIGYQRQQSGIVLASVLLVAGATAGVVSTGEKWRWVIGGGLFRVRNLYITDQNMEYRKSMVKLKFYKDSADATVSVEEGPIAITNNTSQLTLRINGKSDASSAGDIATQYLLAHLPMIARPDAKEVFVLGFGSGITAGALLGHPIQRLTLAENCQPVLQAGPLFAPWNRGVLTNSRTRVFNDDARAVLKLRPDKYDVIVSEPSNPWVVGVGSVFNQDFYKLCANRLTDHGVMAQWFHKYEMTDDIVFLVFRTFSSVFPNMEIWDSQEGDLILLGSKTPWPSDPAHYQPVFDRAEPAKDLAALRITSPAVLWTRQVASQKIGAAIAGDGPVQSDEFPLLEYAAPKAFFLGAAANHMYFFDERTVQFTLADRAKIEVMRALPKNELVYSFRLFLPSSPDILLYLQSLSGIPNAPRIDPMGYIIFRPAESYPEDGLVKPGARPEVVDCVKAEAGLLRDDANWNVYVGQIEKVLTTMISKNDVIPKEFGPKYFAALGARCAIGHGDYMTAMRLLRLGFVFDAYDEQLQFLSRVNDRIVPPEVLAKARAADKFAK